MAGRIPGHGTWETNPKFTEPLGVDLSLELMPAMLARGGYYTAHIGKYVVNAGGEDVVPASSAGRALLH